MGSATALTRDWLRGRLASQRPFARLVIAFSGGLDSSVLMHLVAGLDMPALVVHIDHQLQPDSADWAEHCIRQCQERGLSCELLRPDWQPLPGESIEEQARELRYRLLADFLQADDLLLLAHHRDDQAETLLLRLMRGAGVDGLGAMPVSRPLGRGRLFRPLIGIPRMALRDYAERHGLAFIEDPSNRDQRHDRNFIRHQVMPLLRQRWPAADKLLARSAADCAEVSQTLAAQADELLAGCRHGSALRLDRLRELAGWQQRLLLRRWLKLRGQRVPQRSRLDEALRQVLGAETDRGPEVAFDQLSLRRFRQLLYLTPPGQLSAPTEPIDWAAGSPELLLPNGGRLLRNETDLSLTVIAWPPGERVRLAGRSGSRSQKKLAQEFAIPPWIRSGLLLVYAGDELLAVAGIAGCVEAAPRIDWQLPAGWEWRT